MLRLSRFLSWPFHGAAKAPDDGMNRPGAAPGKSRRPPSLVDLAERQDLGKPGSRTLASFSPRDLSGTR